MTELSETEVALVRSYLAQRDLIVQGMDRQFEEVKATLHEIMRRQDLTNGRLTAVERWVNRLVGAVAMFTVGLPAVAFVVQLVST